MLKFVDNFEFFRYNTYSFFSRLEVIFLAKPMTYKDEDNLKCKNKTHELLSELPYFVTEYTYELSTTVTSRTALAYIYDIRRFLKWLSKSHYSATEENLKAITIEDINLLNINDINEYKYFLSIDSNNSNKEKGIARKMASLNSLLDYLYRTDKIKENPMSKIKNSRRSKKKDPIIRLQNDETKSFLGAIEASGEQVVSDRQQKFLEKTKIRDLAIVVLFLGTGIRVSECVGIDLADLNFKEHKIRIIRKGEKVQNVAMGDEVESFLLAYLEKRSDITPLPGHENALFLSSQRKRLTVKSVENIVKKFAKIAGIEKNISPHKLRKTYGTELYNLTGDIYLVARALGHSSVNTSKDYYIMSDEESLVDARNVVKIKKE